MSTKKRNPQKRGSKERADFRLRKSSKKRKRTRNIRNQLLGQPDQTAINAMLGIFN